MWFSKGVALRSLREAVRHAGTEVSWTFVCDGGMSDDVAGLVDPDDRRVTISGGTAAASFRATIDVIRADAVTDAGDTFYWIAEDDYLYRSDAIRTLMAAAARFGPSAYLSLYTSDAREWCASHPSQPDFSVPPLTGRVEQDVDGIAWHRSNSSTSTMGLWRDTLIADAWLLRFGTRAGSPFDGATWAALQGIAPFPPRHVFDDLAGSWTRRGVAKVIGKPPMRLLVDAAALFRRGDGRSRMLVTPVQDLAMHLETAVIPPGSDWGAQARALLES